MRHYLTAFVMAAALSIGAAQAAPGFGASSHRLGGGVQPAEREGKALSAFEAFLGLLGFDLSASVEPVVSENATGRNGKLKECDEAKKTDIAKAESKDGAEGGSSKDKSRAGEPVYLAF